MGRIGQKAAETRLSLRFVLLGGAVDASPERQPDPRSAMFGALTGIPAARDTSHPIRIVFVCTGNTGRSVAAAALATAIIATHHLNAQAISRAVNWDPGNIQAEANFVALFRQRGIDLSPHVAAPFVTQDAMLSDVILTMTEAHKARVIAHFPEAEDRVFTIAEYATGQPRDVLDAFGQPIDFYKKVLGQLDRLVGAAVLKAVKP